MRTSFKRNKLYSSYKIIACLLLLAGTFGCEEKQPDTNTISGAEILPAPQNFEIKEGKFIDPKDLEAIYIASDTKDANFVANELRMKINELFEHDVKIKVAESYDGLSSPAIVLGIPSKDQGFSSYTSELPAPKKDNSQAYVLEAKDGMITLSGGDQAGLFYGVQTLGQLFEEVKWKEQNLPGLLIEDWPDMEERWVHYNYFFHLDRYEYIEEAIKKMAKYKINGIVFEFEDKFDYKSHPFIAAPNSFSSEQVKELTKYASQYNVAIVPLVQGFGHAGYLLKHDEIKHLREDPESNQSFCPMNEETYDLIFDLYRETIEATPGVKYFHLGGDEVRRIGYCDRCKKKIAEVGELGLYLVWLNRARDFMEEHGRIPIFWDDMPLKQAGGVYDLTRRKANEKYDSIWTNGVAQLNKTIHKFPTDGVFMRWNYELGREKGNIQILDWYRENNFKTMAATAIIGDWPLIPKYDWTPNNIKSFITLAAEKGAMGQLCTAWGDDSGNHSEIYWLGFLASSEYSWSRKSPETIEEYWEKYIHRFFGPDTDGLISAFHNLSERVYFWDTGLMEKGNKRRKGYQLKSLPDFNEIPPEGSWTAHFKPLMEQALEEKAKCAEGTKIIVDNIPKVKDNAYNLEVFASMGRFMEAYTDLVLSIGEMSRISDEVKEANDKGQQKEMAEGLENMASIANDSWNEYVASYEDLKKIWEVTRYPKGGKEYMLNPQTIYMAGRTKDLSYLILAEQEMDFQGFAKNMIDQAKILTGK
ncbi:family 20 glycosylhydrolase [Kriegella aquimaris]|uniref:Glycosyl hydrolase family 20, domain 2 n=1 Tax=Kriegella aquimaris TaxID=192904 RepID=A0A1G9VGH0_9FLAO|nr:family 20 glycosylhydrolase [Kriegella aquimaris]SDM71200.1 Glycosyl hydrolase family 20, domain 2 [Kriegella aquimaris]